MSKKKNKDCKLYNTDRLAKNIWRTMAEDFRAIHGKSFLIDAEHALSRSLQEYRDYSYPSPMGTSVPFFKASIQMESLLKKYRFANDSFTDNELDAVTLKSFIDFQQKVSLPMDVNLTTFAVLQEARKIVKGVLGKYDPEAMLKFVKFGKKSSIGCPLDLAYIDEKLSNVKAFTSSSRCAKWFKDKILSNDGILNGLVGRFFKDGDLAHETLTLINVPKTWKILRTITPLTLIGLFYSYGIGGLVTECLKNVGIDITRQQNRHKYWIKRFSKTLSHVTADLTRASDSITIELLMRLLPRDWWTAIKMCLARDVEFKRKSEVDRAWHKMKVGSILPMGNGCTFPVETLIFYSLIRAIGNLTKVEGLYSVYGDDLIYPRGIHKYVEAIFPRLHITLNRDKTFVDHQFRESCGADYYRGCDVRPFFFRSDEVHVSRTKYLAVLYKTYNGLIRRWDESEIRSTLYFLLCEIANVADSVYRVPPTYPDTAGIKTEYPRFVPLGCKNVNWHPIYSYFEGSTWYRFSYLAERPKKRFVKMVEPYYWLALQGLDDLVRPDFGMGRYSEYGEAKTSPLTWLKTKFVRTYKDKKGKVHRKTNVRFKPAVASRTAIATMSTSGSVTDWI